MQDLYHQPKHVDDLVAKPSVVKAVCREQVRIAGPINPKSLNPKPLNPKPLNPKTLKP